MPLVPPARRVKVWLRAVDQGEMSTGATLKDQELLEDTRRRWGSRMTSRELLAGGVSGAGFIAAVAGLWVARPPGSFAPLPALLCVIVLVLSTRVRFGTPFGFTVPTQLAFVPLLFAMPPSIVPVAVAGAFVLTLLPRMASGELPPSRLLLQLSNAWFSIGPVVVLALANEQPWRAGPGVLIAALAAQFVTDFGVCALHETITRAESFVTLARASWVYAIDAALSGVGLVVAERIHTAPVTVLALVPLLGVLAMFARERDQRLESMLELSSAYRGTALVLGDVIQADDGYTGEHCKSVVTLCLELADHLELTPEHKRNLEFAALLHDVGKIAIPNEIINKPGKLDPHEWTIIKTHTIEGQKMLELVGGFMRQVGLIVRSHHERWDGGGYPDGLAGEQIPLEARIVACCDTWHAMRSDRAYRKALPQEVALAELLTNSGSQFDPKVVEGFLQVIGHEQLETPSPHQAHEAARRHGAALANAQAL